MTNKSFKVFLTEQHLFASELVQFRHFVKTFNFKDEKSGLKITVSLGSWNGHFLFYLLFNVLFFINISTTAIMLMLKLRQKALSAVADCNH